MIMDPAPEVPISNTDAMVRDTYQKQLNDCMTVRCIMKAAMSDEFSCKFNNAQPKKILQILNKSFGTLEDLSSAGHQSSEKGKKSMVHRFHARASKSNRTNQSKED